MVNFLRKVIKSFLNIFRNQKRSSYKSNFQSPGSQSFISNNVVKRTAKYHWQEKGWLKAIDKTFNIYHGYYKTLYGSFRGRIVESVYGSRLKFYIYNPPYKLQDHPRGHCFFEHHGKGKFFIHFNVEPENIDSGIGKIEQTIRESYSKY